MPEGCVLKDHYESNDEFIPAIAPMVGYDVAMNIPNPEAWNKGRKLKLDAEQIVSIYQVGMSADARKTKYGLTYEEKHENIMKKLDLLGDFNVHPDNVKPYWFDNYGIYSSITRFTKRIAKKASLKNRSPRRNRVTYLEEIDKKI